MKIVAFLSRHQALNPGNIETSLTRAVQKRRRENEGQKKKRGPPLPFPPRSCVFSRLALFALTMEKGCLQAPTFLSIRLLIRYIFSEPAVYVSNSKKKFEYSLCWFGIHSTKNYHKLSYFPTTIKEWKCLPQDMAELPLARLGWMNIFETDK